MIRWLCVYAKLYFRATVPELAYPGGRQDTTAIRKELLLTGTLSFLFHFSMYVFRNNYTLLRFYVNK